MNMGARVCLKTQAISSLKNIKKKSIKRAFLRLVFLFYKRKNMVKLIYERYFLVILFKIIFSIQLISSIDFKTWP